jgi:hypothetical protein
MLSLLTYYLIHSKWYGAITEHAGGHTQNTVNTLIVTVSELRTTLLGLSHVQTTFFN